MEGNNMLDEKKLREYDEKLFDREARKMNGSLTKEELAEEAAIKAEQAVVAEFFKGLKESEATDAN